MDIYFSTDIYRDVADYAASLYPSSSIAVAGGCGRLAEALVNVGIAVKADSGDSPEEGVRAVVAEGDEDFTRKVRLRYRGIPVILLPNYAYGSVFDNYIISGILTIKCDYPKAIFYDIIQDYCKLSASAFAGAFGAYAEVLERATSARRTPNVIEARGMIGESKDNLFAEITTEELILRTAHIKERLNVGGATLLTAAGALRGADDEYADFTYFMNAYIAVLMTIRFTKFKFCSILLGKDSVRERILSERLSLPRAALVPPPRDIAPYRVLAERYAPAEVDLREADMRFYVETGGRGRADLKKLLDNYVIAAGYGEFDGVTGLLARSGFIDAIIDETV